ncbi:MAG: hypothetical protein M0014_01940 [Actinomycetota bacterium]|jgi:hypothetical protein|nr:hypothetical protein [Actinomycetota bacterium]
MLTLQPDAAVALSTVSPWRLCLGDLERRARDGLRSARLVSVSIDDALLLCASARRAPASRERSELQLDRFASYLAAAEGDEVALSAGYVLELVQVARRGTVGLVPA